MLHAAGSSLLGTWWCVSMPRLLGRALVPYPRRFESASRPAVSQSGLEAHCPGKRRGNGFTVASPKPQKVTARPSPIVGFHALQIAVRSVPSMLSLRTHASVITRTGENPSAAVVSDVRCMSAVWRRFGFRY